MKQKYFICIKGKLRLMAVEKLSKVFSFFRKASASEKVLNAAQKGKMPSLYMQNLQSIENLAVRESLTDYVSLFAKKTSGKYQMMKAQVDDITYKLSQCEDSLIKSQVEELLISAGNKSRKDAFKLVSKAELLLDSVNSSTGKYSTLFNPKSPIGLFGSYNKVVRKKSQIEKALQKEDLTKVDKIKMEIEEDLSEPYKLSMYAKRHHIDLPENELSLEARFNNLKSYIELHPQDKDTATYLWRQYFLSHQDRATQNILNDIYNDFGVRVCFNQKPEKLELVCLKEHLSQFKKALGDKTKFPALFDINKDYYMFTNNAGGYTNHCSKIVVPNDSIIGNFGKNYRFQTVRHEMAHMQDTKVLGLIRRIRRIRKVKRSIIDIQELKNYGLTDDHARYFYKNKLEANAVFAELDMGKVSENLKYKMFHKIKGLPEEIVNLRDISRVKCALLTNFYNKQNNKIIEKLEETLGGEISPKVAKIILENPNYFKLIKNICKKQPKGIAMTENDFIKTFKNKINEYKEGLAKGTDTESWIIEMKDDHHLPDIYLSHFIDNIQKFS